MISIRQAYNQLHRSGQTLASRLSRAGPLALAYQLVVGLLGAAAIAHALTASAYRDAEGSLQGAFALPLSIGVALMVLIWARSLKWFAFWAAIALTGQAVTLQLTEAGKMMRYQHYPPFSRLLTEFSPGLLLFLVAQTVLVLVGLWPRWTRIYNWLRRQFRPWQLLGVLAVFVLSSATVSRDVVRYLAELALAAYVQSLSLLSVLLAVWALPAERLPDWKLKLERIVGAGALPHRGIDRFAILAAVWVTVAAAGFSFFAYERHPHIPDEVAYLYQARLFADGAMTAPAPLVPEAFSFYLMQFDGAQWYAAPPVGWPLMLALGVKLGVPWLVNPVLGGLNLLLVYYVCGRLYSRSIARLVILLLCASPWYVFMAMNFMTHTFTLTCALAAAAGLIRSRETHHARWAWVAGLALGLLSLIRPLEGLLGAGLIGLWAIGLGGQRLRAGSLAGLIAGTVLVGGLVLPYNYALTGSATTFPINAYTDERFGPNANAYGFGPERGMGWPIDPNLGHTPVDGLINANLNVFSLNIELFGWSTGSLLLVAVLLFSGAFHKSDFLMLAWMAAIFVFFFFYYFSGGPDFGARYWYLMIVPLAALTARGAQSLQGRLAASPAGHLAATRVLVAVGLLCSFALVNFLPWRAVDKYYHYLNMRPDIRQLSAEHNFGPSLVLIQGDEHPDYASAAVYNPVDMTASAPLYAWDRNAEVRRQVLAAYADRPVWIVAGPSITGRGYQVIAGPLPAVALQADP